ncbi:MAG: hypothetical protein DMD76_28590 [Candidatus Rokuibacteriota bacterium]|nr:MAG: hypothetical protein DMD76_28590 [Candidatus Rokubacteria bacterium]
MRRARSCLCRAVALLSRYPRTRADRGSYGGSSYHHLLVNVVPRLRRKGVDDAGMRRLLVENPARAFVFV